MSDKEKIKILSRYFQSNRTDDLVEMLDKGNYDFEKLNRTINSPYTGEPMYLRHRFELQNGLTTYMEYYYCDKTKEEFTTTELDEEYYERIRTIKNK